MKKKLHLLWILLLSLNTGCDDGFLHTTPYDGLSNALIYNSDANASMAVNGIYNALSRNAFYTDFYSYVNNLGPESYEHNRGPWGLTHSQGLATTRDVNIATNYRNFYRPIIYANDLIAGMDGNTKITETLRNRLVGEAKFSRAICYFYLWNLYGGVVILDKPTPVNETYLPRNTDRQVIDLIIKDLTEAIELLPVTYTAATDLGRITKGAAIAMLGKTLLFDKQWAAAATQFEKLMAAPYKYTLVADYGDNFRTATENNIESVFELQYVQQDGLGSSFDRWYGSRSVLVGGGDRANMSSHALTAFTKLDGSKIDMTTIPKRSAYKDDITHGVDLMAWYKKTYADADLRLHKSAILPASTYVGAGNITYQLYWPYAPYVKANPPALNTTFQAEAKILIRKFVTIGDEHTLFREDSPMNYPLIRFADVLLMYAEAKNEVGGAGPEVHTAVNRVRSRAGVAKLPAALTKDEMRRNIWLERYKELMFEGHLYFDVKRWRTAHTTDPLFGLNHDVRDYRFEKTLFKKAFREDRDYLWPIPGAEMDINKKLTQNPGW